MKDFTAILATVAVSLTLAGCHTETKTETKTSTSTSTSTSTVTSSAPTSSATPGAQANKTIADYIVENHITETPVHPGDPGSPTINLPTPNGWQPLPPGGAPYWGLAYGQPADAADPPTLAALVSKLTGNVDPNKILEYAPGELKNLPGFEAGSGNGKESTLGVPPGQSFKAWQFGGSYTKNGKRRTVAQKTVVIPGADGVYVLQINADALEDEMGPLMDATNVIDEQTTITP
ncbi:LpqN/LpqT family lipoprotein [Mycobacterium asiaticum]|uniref:Lipoprotein LpqN n=1 Tax=Mycobacterium asiaticum TaxID=1790 RepID=A0A1A3MZK2_MYCAS|nr:LpqN/LpqT family lipoprotein [Mycobacterium asiaticum]OBK14520.1 hypothetical protein A5636_07725 [Mycobacterium asiaticum]